MDGPQFFVQPKTCVVFPHQTFWIAGRENQHADGVFGVGERVFLEDGHRVKPLSPVGQTVQILDDRFWNDPHRIVVVRNGPLDGDLEQVVEDTGPRRVNKAGWLLLEICLLYTSPSPRDPT